MNAIETKIEELEEQIGALGSEAEEYDDLVSALSTMQDVGANCNFHLVDEGLARVRFDQCLQKASDFSKETWDKIDVLEKMRDALAEELED